MSTVVEEVVSLKCGAGGPAMRALIKSVLIDGLVRDEAEGTIGLGALDDGAAIRIGNQWLVVTTDSHVIQPVFFPGGDIGRLAVCGTVNDLAMMGATDVLALTCAVIVEDGFRRADLVRIQRSIQDACAEAHAPIVTGDTKVMGRGEIDGLVINTTGVALTWRVVPGGGLRPGDRIIITGTIGDHGMAVLARRLGLELEGDLRSDVAPLNGLIRAALDEVAGGIVAMKDPTRGGVASALHEMAEAGGVGVVLDEPALPLTAPVRAAAELVGIDPLHVANEGKAILGVRPEAVDAVLARLRRHPLGAEAAVIGTCTADWRGSLILDTGFGRRLVSEPDGELLPRIC